MISILSAVLVLVVGSAVVFTQWQVRRIEQQFPPRGQFVSVSGGRLHYTERLPLDGGSAQTVLLLHGASGNQADVMLPLGDKLAARGFHVIAVDRPGHGWSDRPKGAEDASPAAQAGLIREGLASLNIRNAIVVGHSLAGAVAANFAIEQKDFTRGLVLLAPVTHPWPGGVTWYYTLAARPVIGWLFGNVVTMPVGLASLSAAVQSVFAPQTPPPDYAERTGSELVLRPSEFISNAQDVAGLAAFIDIQSKRMSEIAAPTTIVTGDRDSIVYAHIHSAGSARDIAGAHLVTLPGVGHAVHNVAPDRVVDAVTDVAMRADQAQLQRPSRFTEMR
ncbi:MAG: alpha/beta hydrolase [Beijerinckiaceae bacterium]|nr:alpha/beta hydrolase [Beijerinckiaceae bacterium]